MGAGRYSPGTPSALTQIVHYSSSHYTVFHSVIYNSVYSPSSQPSCTVLLLDVMYTTDPHHRSKSYSPPWAAPFHLFLHDTTHEQYTVLIHKYHTGTVFIVIVIVIYIYL